jgi:hypothetical protein
LHCFLCHSRHLLPFFFFGGLGVSGFRFQTQLKNKRFSGAWLLFGEGIGPMSEADGACASTPDLDDIESGRHPEMAAGLAVGFRAKEQVMPFAAIHRKQGGDFVKFLSRTDASRLDFDEAELPGAAQGNQVHLASAMGRSPVACQAVISAIIQVASRGRFAGSANACAKPSQAHCLRRK